MKLLLTLFIIFMFFPIPLKFYIYYYNNNYYIKLYDFILFDNAVLKKKKEKTDQKKNNPPIKSKIKSKLSEIITYSNIMEIINKFIYL